MGSFTKEVSTLRLISIDNDYVYFNLFYLFVYVAPRGKLFSLKSATSRDFTTLFDVSKKSFTTLFMVS